MKQDYPRGQRPVPHHDELGSREPAMADLCRMIKGRFNELYRNLENMESHFDQQDGKLDEVTKEIRAIDQRLAGLEHDAR